MNHLSVSILVLCTFLAPVVWAQQRVAPHMGRHMPPTVSPTNNLSRTTRTAQSDDVKIYYLGHDSGGTWAEPRGINDFGAVVAEGDVAGAYTHQIWASLFAPQAGWSDLGSFGE